VFLTFSFWLIRVPFLLISSLIFFQTLRATETQVLVSILGDDLSLAAEIVRELWVAKLKAAYMLDKRVKKQIAHALDSGIPLMVIVGETELKEGKVRLKDLSATEEFDIARSSLVEEVRRRLSGGETTR
jgi:histidyl-tRNA synthetase